MRTPAETVIDLSDAFDLFGNAIENEPSAPLLIERDTETGAAWIADIPEMADLRLLVRGMDSSPVRRAGKTAFRRSLSASEQMGLVPTWLADTPGKLAGQRREALLRSLEAALLGWDNLTDQGAPVEYSSALASRMIRDPEFIRFRCAVLWAATVVCQDGAA